MPTVLWIGGARVVIYPNDHPPAHVHVIDGGKHARIALPSAHSGEHPTLDEVHGYSRAELRRILEAVDEAASKLRREWSRIHG